MIFSQVFTMKHKKYTLLYRVRTNVKYAATVISMEISLIRFNREWVCLQNSTFDWSWVFHWTNMKHTVTGWWTSNIMPRVSTKWNHMLVASYLKQNYRFWGKCDIHRQPMWFFSCNEWRQHGWGCVPIIKIWRWWRGKDFPQLHSYAMFFHDFQ